jgi:hypothetical protein
MAKSITSGSLPAGRQVNKKLHSFFPAGLRGTCLVFFFYIVINCFGSVLAAIA